MFAYLQATVKVRLWKSQKPRPGVNSVTMSKTSPAHSSPARFTEAWLTEHEFTRVGFLGIQPPLDAGVAASVNLQDCNCKAPLTAVTAHGKLNCIVVSGCLEEMSRREGLQLLAGYRNALIEAILVFIDQQRCADWQPTDFYCMGFHQVAEFPHQEHPLAAFEYTIRHYNHQRLWNNSRFWANPQNFGKYWW